MQQSRSPDVVDDQLYVCACVCVRILCVRACVADTYMHTQTHTDTCTRYIIYSCGRNAPCSKQGHRETPAQEKEEERLYLRSTTRGGGGALFMGPKCPGLPLARTGITAAP